jgi:K+-sensing histidine kinase KdpD
MIAAWLGGLWPGILTTAITGAATQYFWIEPTYSWKVTSPSETLGLMVFLSVGAVISVLNHAWRSSTVALSESEARLTATPRDLEKALRARDEFLSVASHELRNPVNAVQLQLAGVLREIERHRGVLDSEWLGDRIGKAQGHLANHRRSSGAGARAR